MGAKPMSLINQQKEVDSSRVLRGGAITIVLSVIANLILLWAANLLLTLPPEFDPLEPLRISIFTAVFVIGGVVVYALLTTKKERPISVYQRIVWIFLAVSFIPDIVMLFVDFMPGANVTAVTVLMLTHVPPALICIYLLPALTKVK